MADLHDMPEMELVPKAIIQLAIPSEPFYVLDEAGEVRQKLTDLKNDYGGVMGEAHDESGLLVLTEIELHTRPEVSPEALERSINPQLVAWVKEVHPNYWADQLRTAAEANAQWKAYEEREGGENPALAGLPEPIRNLIEGLTSGEATIVGGSGEGMSATEFGEEDNAKKECCCSHRAEVHEVGDKIGGCEECGCARFHTH